MKIKINCVYFSLDIIIFLPKILLLNLLFLSFPSFGKSKNPPKVQEVNFNEMSLKGTVRNPDGAYLVQKRGIRFLPLYEVQKDVDSKLRKSSQYLRY